jgi:hypothetical protein
MWALTLTLRQCPQTNLRLRRRLHRCHLYHALRHDHPGYRLYPRKVPEGKTVGETIVNLSVLEWDVELVMN